MGLTYDERFFVYRVIELDDRFDVGEIRAAQAVEEFIALCSVLGEDEDRARYVHAIARRYQRLRKESTYAALLD